MRIYSWNMYSHNRETDRIFDFIKESDFDVFCLQEVQKEFLERLRILPYHLAETIDKDRLFRTVVRDHLVILSRYPIEHVGTIPWEDYWPILPLRTRIFVVLMRPLKWTKIKNRNGL